MIRYFFITLAVIVSLPLAAPAQQRKEIQVKTTRLGENIYMLSSGAGGNLALCVNDKGAVLVDSEYDKLNAKVKEAISTVCNKPVTFVINTHWHFDHVLGNVEFAKTGSHIVAHVNAKKRMATDQRIDILDYDVPALPEEGLPTVVFDDRLTLTSGIETISIQHMPHAHTDGDAIVHFKEANVIHAGDIFFNCGYPFIDIDNGGNVNGVIAAVEKILRLCDDETRIIPGHGPLGAKADLETYLGMLRDFRAIIASEMDAGKDLATLIEEKPTAELDGKWGGRFFSPAQFTEIVVRSINEKAPSPEVDQCRKK